MKPIKMSVMFILPALDDEPALACHKSFNLEYAEMRDLLEMLEIYEEDKSKEQLCAIHADMGIEA